MSSRHPSRSLAGRTTPSAAIRFPRVPLPPPRRMTGRERRWLDPGGPIKIVERTLDRVASRYVYPHLLGIWSPYSWQLPRRLEVSEVTIRPTPWPAAVAPLSLLLLTDIHTGPFLRPDVLDDVLRELMKLEPDLVVIGGDIVSADENELEPFLTGLRVLARAPLGAWFVMGNHEYFTPTPSRVVERLETIGITTLLNRSVTIEHGGGRFRMGGLDDLVLGAPDWELMLADGRPDLLLSHNPDVFYDAVARGIGLVLSGHTHAGQIRIPGRPPIIRQSRFGLDEGHMTFESGQIVVSRGLGVSNLPWRLGVRPEALLLTIVGN